MSTNGMTSWAVDQGIGEIYPFQGCEVLLVVLGFAFWIGWHIVQTRQESEEIASDLAADRAATKRGLRSVATRPISSERLTCGRRRRLCRRRLFLYVRRVKSSRAATGFQGSSRAAQA